ncbi:MAG TPA: hypothetical protein DD381_05900 [Lentisphaeria bacterium]|nr:MAG: hypothetical protein A2X47_14205 [Lentisphaerae bacterium GWF2_38_69]HBM15858.1 hypothetical protein [Lentisphaeria bacterium]
MKVGIIGAGYAGVSAALEAAKSGAEVHLFSEESVLPYYRPRIIAAAFGQIRSEEVYMHPAGWYKDNNIELNLNSKVEAIEQEGKSFSVISNGIKFLFDSIVVCTGAKPIIPGFAANHLNDSRITPLWTLDNAMEISSKIENVKTIAVIGGGLIGLETALRAAEKGLRVTVIEKAHRLLERNFSLKGSETIKRLLHIKEINVITEATVKSILPKPDYLEIITGNETFKAELCILSVGCVSNDQFKISPDIEKEYGFFVDGFLESSVPAFFAAGDCANLKNTSRQFSVLRALSQGKTAGINAANLNKKTKFEPGHISLDLKYKDFEIHSIGHVHHENLKNKTTSILEEENTSYRAILNDGEIVYGIEMVGSAREFNHYRKLLK